jgi:hypothetical protein
METHTLSLRSHEWGDANDICGWDADVSFEVPAGSDISVWQNTIEVTLKQLFASIGQELFDGNDSYLCEEYHGDIGDFCETAYFAEVANDVAANLVKQRCWTAFWHSTDYFIVLDHAECGCEATLLEPGNVREVKLSWNENGDMAIIPIDPT